MRCIGRYPRVRIRLGMDVVRCLLGQGSHNGLYSAVLRLSSFVNLVQSDADEIQCINKDAVQVAGSYSISAPESLLLSRSYQGVGG